MAVKHKKCKKQRYLEPSHSTVWCCVAWLTGFSKGEALCGFSPLMHRKGPGRLKSWFLESKDPKGFWTSTMAAADFIAVLQELSSLRIVFEGARGRIGPQHWEANTGTLCSSENCPQTGEVQLRQLWEFGWSTNPSARLPQSLSFQAEQFKHIKLIGICLKRKGLSVFSITQHGWPVEVTLCKTMLWSASGLKCVSRHVSVIPHFTTLAVRKGNGGFGSTTGPVGSSDEWCALPRLDHSFRARLCTWVTKNAHPSATKMF